MALPKLLQKLFTNGGAGNKLNQDIIPDIPYSKNLGETSMVSLGFAKDSTVTLLQFFQKLAEKGYTESNSVLKFSYLYAHAAYVTDGTNTVRIVGGTLYLGQNTHTPSDDYGVAWGLFVPSERTKLYRFITYKDISQAASDSPLQRIYPYESEEFPVGFIALYAGSNVPDGWFRCDGSTIANMATNYPKLYAVLGTNVLPNYSGKVPLGAPSDINASVPAGLPNITGQVMSDNNEYYWGAGTWAAGAFANAHEGGSYIGAHAWSGDPPRGNGFTFDASRSSAIYGKSTTVTPPSVKVAVLIRHD